MYLEQKIDGMLPHERVFLVNRAKETTREFWAETTSTSSEKTCSMRGNRAKKYDIGVSPSLQPR